MEQNALLQGLTNVGVTYVGFCGMFEYFVVVCGHLISIKSLLVLVTGFLTFINNLCSFFFISSWAIGGLPRTPDPAEAVHWKI